MTLSDHGPGLQGCNIFRYKYVTRKLCYRKDDRAMRAI